MIPARAPPTASAVSAIRCMNFFMVSSYVSLWQRNASARTERSFGVCPAEGQRTARPGGAHRSGYADGGLHGRSSGNRSEALRQGYRSIRTDLDTGEHNIRRIGPARVSDGELDIH